MLLYTTTRIFSNKQNSDSLDRTSQTPIRSSKMNELRFARWNLRSGAGNAWDLLCLPLHLLPTQQKTLRNVQTSARIDCFHFGIQIRCHHSASIVQLGPTAAAAAAIRPSGSWIIISSSGTPKKPSASSLLPGWRIIISVHGWLAPLAAAAAP